MTIRYRSRPPVMDSFKGLVSRPSNSSAEYYRSNSVRIGSVSSSLRQSGSRVAI
jgi:hypothetical protein